LASLSPQEHKLIRYMDQRSRANGQVPVMCPYEELLQAIWGEEPLHTEDEISHLIYELRQKLEPNPGEPQFPNHGHPGPGRHGHRLPGP
jgi:DNA-binding response OmpR family regulator